MVSNRKFEKGLWMNNDKRLKKIGLMLILILGFLASLFYFKHLLFAALSFTILLVIVFFQILLYPQGLTSTEKVLIRIGDVLGWINSQILLGILFYLVITPLGFCLKLLNKSTIHDFLDPEASSYWKNAEAPKNPESYKRQF